MGFAKKVVQCRTLLCTLYRVFHNSIHRLLPHLQSCCQTSVLSLKTWSWLCFTPVTTTRTRRTRTPTKYLSCYWPDFDQTLNVGTWEPLEQIPTVTVTFVHATFVLVTYISISGISQMLLAWFWLNFKGRFLGLSLTDANCYGDICQGNICPGNICPYQKYISCYWSDFDQTFWTQFLGAFFGPRNLLYPKLFDLNSFWPDFFLPKFFSPNFLDLFFLT